MDWSKIFEIGITVIATLAAAYGGARAAFHFDKKREDEKTREARIEACNRAMLNLTRQFNWLINYRDQFLEPFRQNPGRHLMMLPSNELKFSSWEIDIAPLAFLANTAASEIPFMVAVLQGRFFAVIDAVNARSPVHREFQEKLGSSEVGMHVELPLEAFETAVGDRLALTLRNATEQIYDLVDTAISEMSSAGQSYRDVLKTLFPAATIYGFTLPKDIHNK